MALDGVDALMVPARRRELRRVELGDPDEAVKEDAAAGEMFMAIIFEIMTTRRGRRRRRNETTRHREVEVIWRGFTFLHFWQNWESRLILTTYPRFARD